MTLTIQTTGLPVELRPSMAALVHGLIILPVDLSVSCVVRRPVQMTHLKSENCSQAGVRVCTLYKHTYIHVDHLTLLSANILCLFHVISYH